MKRTTLVFSVLGAATVLIGGLANAAPDASSKEIQSAESAAPPAISRNATVMGADAVGHMVVLRQGTNRWTCMPDDPATPANDPMCVDANGLAWVQAWMAHKNPSADQVGMAYMLQGAADASNNDAYATKPAAGQDWVRTGPHLMILNANAAGAFGDGE